MMGMGWWVCASASSRALSLTDAARAEARDTDGMDRMGMDHSTTVHRVVLATALRSTSSTVLAVTTPAIPVMIYTVVGLLLATATTTVLL